MNIEIGSKWKHKESKKIVEVNDKHEMILSSNSWNMKTFEVVWFIEQYKGMRILTKNDFLEQYKSCEPVYEYQYAFRGPAIISNTYYTEEEAKFLVDNQRLDFTKRERKCD